MKPEAQLILQIKQYLKLNQVYFHRINTGLIANEKNRFYRSAEVGTPDLLCCIAGYFVAIEAKSPIGRQTEAQKRDQEWLEWAGGQYWLIRDLTSLEQNIKRLKRAAKAKQQPQLL